MARNHIKVSLSLADKGYLAGIGQATNKAGQFGKAMERAGATALLTMDKVGERFNSVGAAASRLGSQAQQTGSRFRGIGDEAGKAGSRAKGAMGGAGASTGQLASKAQQAGSSFRSLGNEIQGAITKTYLWVQALEMALGVVSKIGDQFNKASEIQLGGINTSAQISAITGNAFKGSQELLTASNKRVARMAVELPVSTQQIQETRSNAIDNILLAQKETTGKTDIKAALPQAENLGAKMALMGQAAGLGGVQLQATTNRLLSPDVTEARMEMTQLAAAVPGLMSMIDEFAASIGKDFNSLNRFERLTALETSLDKIYSPEVISEMTKTGKAQLIQAGERLFDPTVGLFGFLRDVKPLKGEQNILGGIEGLLASVIGTEGVFSKFGKIASVLGLGGDPLAGAYDALVTVTGWADRFSKWLNNLVGPIQRVKDSLSGGIEVPDVGIEERLAGFAEVGGDWLKRTFNADKIAGLLDKATSSVAGIDAAGLGNAAGKALAGFSHTVQDWLQSLDWEAVMGGGFKVLGSLHRLGWEVGTSLSKATLSLLMRVAWEIPGMLANTAGTFYKVSSTFAGELTQQLIIAGVKLGYEVGKRFQESGMELAGQFVRDVINPVTRGFVGLGKLIDTNVIRLQSWTGKKWGEIVGTGQRLFNTVESFLSRITNWVIRQINRIPFVNIPMQSSASQPVSNSPSVVESFTQPPTVEKKPEPKPENLGDRLKQGLKDIFGGAEDYTGKPVSFNPKIENLVKQPSVSFNPTVESQPFSFDGLASMPLVTPTVHKSESKSVVNDFKNVFNISQQPGEDAEALTQRVVARFEQMWRKAELEVV